jgi:glucokinase
MDGEISLIGDIGGTNCRLALARDGNLLRESVFTCTVDSFPTPVQALESYLSRWNTEVERACLAIAGPVDGDTVHLTNHCWTFSIERIKIQLGLKSLRILNDFEAVGIALPHLEANRLEQVGGKHSIAGKPKVALGPGTGYGATHLHSNDDGVLAFPTECGHVSIAPSNQREVNLCQWLLQQELPITCEQLLSGPGLQTLYRALFDLEFSGIMPEFEYLTSAKIQTRAVAGSDPLCVATLDLFCDLLGTAARDQALSCLAKGGVYIAGGIVQRFIPFLRASNFRKRFENSATMGAILEQIPVYIVTEEYPGLIGAARMISRI